MLTVVRLALVVGIFVSHYFWSWGPLVLAGVVIIGCWIWWWLAEGKRAEPTTIYYDDAIRPVIRYRHEWGPTSWVRRLGVRASPWMRINGYFTGTRLRVTDRTIEVRMPGSALLAGLRKLVFGFDRSLKPDETTMETTRLSLSWLLPSPKKSDVLALKRQTGSDSRYILALRPADGNIDRLQSALRKAGVHEN